MATFLVISKSDTILSSWVVKNDFNYLNTSSNFSIYTKDIQDLPTEEARALCLMGLDRIFESCFIAQPETDALRHELAKLLFLELSGSTYISTIDTKLNVACYETLFLGAQNLTSLPLEKILDYGCGPGTVVACPLYRESKILFGFDFIHENCETAKKLGLNILTDSEIGCLENEYFDLVVCSYVLHYKSLTKPTILKLIESLRIGGVWASNFHKSKGISWFRDSLPHNSNIEILIEDSKFGDLIYIKKVGN